MSGETSWYGTKLFQSIEERRREDRSWLEESRQWKAEIIEAIRKNRFDCRNVTSDLHVSQDRQEYVSRKLLNDLKFSEMNDRPSRIAEAHEKTFQWIFQEPRMGPKSWESFVQWLESGDPLYWMTGKAGSGKSTLMKYVYSDRRTLDYLDGWASDATLITAAFFFWNSGTDIQMSQMGLLRTILYQIFQRSPELIPRILPERWEIYNLFGEDRHAWRVEELKQVFKKVNELEDSSMKFCFFIDGLDEFSGKLQELISFIQSIAIPNRMKVCVASRPWVEFEDAFQTSPSLMLENLTYDDITAYVNSSFHQDSGFMELGLREPEYASQLVDAIVQKASGVFLWVTLVVASLLAGLVNGDRVRDLDRRLALLPPDLEKLYQKMLSSLDPFYLGHASALFQLVREMPRATLLLLSFADDTLPAVLAHKTQPITAGEASLRENVMRRRIKSQCKGLLEVGSERYDNSYDFPSQNLVSEADALPNIPFRNARKALTSPVVQYLHRTVKDFLESPEIWSWLRASTETGFDAKLAFCKANLLQLKINFSYLGRGNVAKGCLNYAQSISKYSHNAGMQDDLALILEELDRTAEAIPNMTEINSREAIHPLTLRPAWINHVDIFPSPGEHTGVTFLSLAVRLGLYSYVSAKVRPGCIMKQPARRITYPDHKFIKTTEIWPLLLDACVEDPILKESFPDVTFSAKMVDLLLANGANPYFKAPTAQYTVLETIAMANSVNAVKTLLEQTHLGYIIKVKEKDLMLSIATNNDRTARFSKTGLPIEPKVNGFWPKYYPR